jgi:hypothetical protein
MPKQKRKHSRLPKLPKSVRQDNIHPGFGSKKTPMRIRLEASQITELKQLAREHGTTLAQELDNAFDAYLLGMSQREVRMLHALLDRLNESTDKANRALVAALRETGKTRDFARKKRSGRSTASGWR